MPVPVPAEGAGSRQRKRMGLALLVLASSPPPPLPSHTLSFRVDTPHRKGASACNPAMTSMVWISHPRDMGWGIAFSSGGGGRGAALELGRHWRRHRRWR